MHIENFTQDEQAALRECVAAVKALPIYILPDFEKIFGSSKEEVDEVCSAFPNWDLYDEAAEGYDASGIVVHNALIWLLNGTEEERKAMRAKITFDVNLVPHLYEKLRA